MDAVASLFARFDSLPCAFTVHTPSGISRVGAGEPAFSLGQEVLDVGHGWGGFLQ